jgi:hypothetical protein
VQGGAIKRSLFSTEFELAPYSLGDGDDGGAAIDVAVKTLAGKTTDADEAEFMREAILMGQWEHPNIIGKAFIRSTPTSTRGPLRTASHRIVRALGFFTGLAHAHVSSITLVISYLALALTHSFTLYSHALSRSSLSLSLATLRFERSVAFLKHIVSKRVSVAPTYAFVSCTAYTGLHGYVTKDQPALIVIELVSSAPRNGCSILLAFYVFDLCDLYKVETPPL